MGTPDLDGWRRRSLAQADAIAGLMRGVPAADLRHRPAPGRWTILGIINHLADEDIEDFPLRIRSTIADPAAPWPAIDPESWPETRGYDARDPGESIARFLQGRLAAWTSVMPALANADWDAAHRHPMLGPLRVRDLMAAWLAHDLIHLRQIGGILFQRLPHHGGGASTAYAGTWR